MEPTGRHLFSKRLFPKRWVAGGVALGIAGATALAGCGTASTLPPAQTVAKSMGGVFDQSSLSMDLSVPLTTAQVTQLAGPDSGMPAAAARAFSQAALVFEVQSGHGEALSSKQFYSDTQNRFEFALQVGSTALVQIRYVDQALYGQVLASQLVSDLGLSSSDAANFQGTMDRYNSYVPGLSALGAGRWVAVTESALAPLKSALNQLSPSSSSPSAQAAVRAALDQVVAAIKAAFNANVTYTDNGNQNGETEYTGSLAVLAFVKAASAQLPGALDGIPGFSTFGADITKGLTSIEAKIPASRKLTFQLWESGYRTRQVQVDLKQFDQKLPFSVPIRLQFGQPAAITAPAGATVLNLSKLPSLLEHIIAGAIAGSSSASAA